MQPVQQNLPSGSSQRVTAGVTAGASSAVSVASGDPPSVMKRGRNKEHTQHGPAFKLLLSLLVLAPRLAIGAAYLTSALLKGVVAGVAVAGAKIPIFASKKDAVKSFGEASFRDARRDFSKALLLGMAGILAPLGHLWTAWDVHENGQPTEFTPSNLGSLAKVTTFYPIAAGLQDLIDPYKKPDPHPHTWKKIEGKLDKVADFFTHYQGIERALEKGREKAYRPARIPPEERS